MVGAGLTVDFRGAYNFIGKGEKTEAAGMDELEMTIDSIRVSPMNYQRVVILKEKDADRYLPIWIGPAEADAIAVKLQDLAVPRPLTHDLLRTIIDTLGGAVSHILVSDLHNDTFYAKILIRVNGDLKEIDSRPSDALALAVRSQVPIYAAKSVLDKAGILLDKETGKPIVPGQGQAPSAEQPAEVKEEELRRMSAFTDFINNLDLEDFGKQQPNK
jgi:bifunctional DNase/RNase